MFTTVWSYVPNPILTFFYKTLQEIFRYIIYLWNAYYSVVKSFGQCTKQRLYEDKSLSEWCVMNLITLFQVIPHNGKTLLEYDLQK